MILLPNTSRKIDVFESSGRPQVGVSGCAWTLVRCLVVSKEMLTSFLHRSKLYTYQSTFLIVTTPTESFEFEPGRNSVEAMTTTCWIVEKML